MEMTQGVVELVPDIHAVVDLVTNKDLGQHGVVNLGRVELDDTFASGSRDTERLSVYLTDEVGH